MNEEYKPSSEEKKLLGISYWSFGLGFAFLFPLVFLFAFGGKKKYFSEHLIQSFLLQLLFITITFLLFIAFISTSKSFIQSAIFLEIQTFLRFIFYIVLFILSLLIGKGKNIKIPLIYNISSYIYKFWNTERSINKAYKLTYLLPGLGHLYLRKKILGSLFILIHCINLCIFLFILFAYYHFSIAKDLLGIFGFFWRMGDKAFSEYIITFNNLILSSLLLLLNYFFARISLLFDIKKRQILGSFQVSYLIHLFVLVSLLLIPYIINKTHNKEKIKAQAKRFQEQLKEENLFKKQKQNINKSKQNIKEIQREIQLDLLPPNEINGLNGFSEVGFKKRETPLPNLQEYVKKYNKSTESKSYSEYLTVKVRENDKDDIIWDTAKKPYSSVIEYIVTAEGEIKSIQILESSDELEIDSLVLSVIESMQPLKSPPNNKTIRVTELFWNTEGAEHLDTELKRHLVDYPDGRIIEEIK